MEQEVQQSAKRAEIEWSGAGSERGEGGAQEHRGADVRTSHVERLALAVCVNSEVALGDST